jgi:hypothetical protein
MFKWLQESVEDVLAEDRSINEWLAVRIGSVYCVAL